MQTYIPTNQCTRLVTTYGVINMATSCNGLKSLSTEHHSEKGQRSDEKQTKRGKNNDSLD